MTTGDVEDRLLIIETSMRGDLKGNAGALQNLIRLMNDVYQEPKGLLSRMDRAEQWQLKKEERASGMIYILRGAWILLGVVGGILLKYFMK